ncbi:diacylglycerol kinase family protein [Leptolyngbya sp. FACHB-261]|nr:diacylglycerol kinase family protein [Leptolyngbya sp. FACHB-261]
MSTQLPTTEPRSQQVTPGTGLRQLAWQVAPTLWSSFRYAWAGISYACVTQRNFRVHLIVGSLAIGLGVFLRLAAVEMAVIGLTIGAVLAMELLNTALEAVVDLTVGQSFHPLAKVAKDCAAGAVLIAAFSALLVAASLLLPPLLRVVLSNS